MFEFFKEIKVIELASVLAGPLVGTFFSELGAEVIKVENKTSAGDPTRQWKEANENESSISSYYAAANYNKTSLSLDLTDPADYRKLQSIVSDADILISNYALKTVEKLKVGYEDMKMLKEDIIYAQLYAFSKDIERPGYDIIMQAECGYLSMCGQEESIARMPVALIDVLAAHQLKEAILLALLKKQMHPGEGQYIEVSLYKSAIASLANQGSNFLMNGTIPKRMGTQHPNIAPYGDIYSTSDNKNIILAIGSDKQFKKLVETLNLPKKEFINFMYNKERVSNREGLNELLQSKFINLRSDELEEVLRRKHIPFCFIHNLSDVFGHPLAKEMIRSEVIEGRLTHGVKTISFVI